MHAGDRAVPLEARLDPHQHGVPAAVDVEDLLAGQRDLDRAAGELGQLARGDLVGERVELAAEAAPDRRRDHADVRLRHVEDLGEQPVHVVRGLGGGPERELAVRAPLGHRGVLLHGQVGVALEVEDVLADQVGRAKAASTSPNWSDTALCTFGPSPYSWMRTSGWASASSIDMSAGRGS